MSITHITNKQHLADNLVQLDNINNDLANEAYDSNYSIDSIKELINEQSQIILKLFQICNNDLKLLDVNTGSNKFISFEQHELGLKVHIREKEELKNKLKLIQSVINNIDAAHESTF